MILIFTVKKSEVKDIYFLNVLEMSVVVVHCIGVLLTGDKVKKTHVATSHGDSLSLKSILKSNEKRI